VFPICVYWSTDSLGLHFDFNTDPDPAFHNNADPKPAIIALLAPVSDLKYCLNVCIVEVYIHGDWCRGPQVEVL
jgi:hypothetical protein